MSAAGAIITTVLSNIPWGQVLDNAPKVAEGATRLWSGLRKKGLAEGADESVIVPEPPVTDESAVQVARLQAQVQTLEIEVHDLSAQLQASSELIKALAEQNALLVQRVEMNRLQLRKLTRIAVAVTAILAAGVGVALLRV